MAVAAASKAGDAAAAAVREARAVCQKRLRTLKLESRARPDELHRAGKKMEEMVERANAEVKKVAEAGRKALAAV